MTDIGAAATFLRHGGRIAAAARALPSAPTPWIDLSTGVNPHPYPVPRLDPAKRWRLPDPEDTAALEAVAAAAFGVSSARSVASVPGSESGLKLLPRLLGVTSAAIVGPSYTGHGDSWRAVGTQVSVVPFADIGMVEADVLVVVNPNNPDGQRMPRAALLDLADRQQAKGGWLVVDEAFSEVTSELSVAAHAGRALIVLRSFGKFYGLPGVRLGFVLGGEAVTSGVRSAFGDWPVSCDAISAGLAAYPDRAWADKTRTRLARESARLDRILKAAGFSIVGGTSLFRLVRHEDAASRFIRLAEAGILARPFDFDPSLIRFGLPRGTSDWSRLQAALLETPR